MMLRTRVRLIARNTLRRRARTLFTVGMIAVSVALLLVALTFIRGIFGSTLETGAAASGHVRVVTPEFAAREELMPLYEHLPDYRALAVAIRNQPGVAAVEPRIVAGVTVTAGEEIGDLFAPVVGAQDGYFRGQLRADEHVVAGHWLSGAEDELVVGHFVARQLGAEVGDELVLLGATQDGSLSSIRGELVGIVRGGGGVFDRQILAPLERVQYLVDVPDGAVELLVFGADYQRAPRLADRLRALPALQGYAVDAWSEREPWISIVPWAAAMERIVIFMFVFLTSLGILNTMMMSVLERTHELGVMRAMGLTRAGALGLVVGEASVVAVAGGLLGVAIGAFPAWLVADRGIALGEKTASGMGLPLAETMRGDFGFELVVVAFGLGLLMALLGTLLPAIRAASIQPVTAMRAGR
jgi:putative ABC transport system permease protein